MKNLTYQAKQYRTYNENILFFAGVYSEVLSFWTGTWR